MNSLDRFRPRRLLRVLPALGLLLLPAVLPRAGGAGEPQPFEGQVPVYLLLGENDNPTIAERMLLPASLSLYAWNRFRTEADGISFEAEGGYRLVSRSVVGQEDWKGRQVVGYQVRVSGYSREGGTAGRLIPVSFTYEPGGSEAGEGMLRQPAARAILEAVRASGRDSGLARIREISWLGGGRFQARVEVR